MTLVLMEQPDALRLSKTGGHKYGHGHAVVVTGGAGRTGAARLAARGALRIGAGLVTLAVPGSAQMEVAGAITALMLRRADDGGGLDALLRDDRLNAVCLGPGLGLDRARDLVPVVLGSTGLTARPTVLDADALTAFGDEPDAFFDAAANSLARSFTVSSNFELAITSSTRRHSLARSPRTPSSIEQNTSARSRRTLRLSVTRVRPPVPGRTASSGTSGRATDDVESFVSMM